MAEGADTDSRFPLKYAGPKAGVRYPLKVLYVDVCDGWPLEYCEFHPNYEQAKAWMEENLTDEMRSMYLNTETEEGGEETKKRQKRGGKGQVKTKKKELSPTGVKVMRESRGKKKYTTVVQGLASYGIDLKVASKFFGGRFACGSSVTGEDEIVIQGDVGDDLYDVIPEKWPDARLSEYFNLLIPEKWPDIPEDDVDFVGDQKR